MGMHNNHDCMQNNYEYKNLLTNIKFDVEYIRNIFL